MRASVGRAFGGPGPIDFTGEGVSGPMARSVADCALFLDAMCGYDARAPLSLPAPDEPFQKAVEAVNCKVKTAYVPTLGGFAPVESELESIMQAALAQMIGEGARVDEACPSMEGLNDTYITLRELVWAATAGGACHRKFSSISNRRSPKILRWDAIRPSIRCWMRI